MIVIVSMIASGFWPQGLQSVDQKAVLGDDMSSCNGVELRLVPDDRAGSGADVFDFCSRQSEGSRLRRIAALEYENELLRRTVSEIRIELIWLEQISKSDSGHPTP